MSSPRSSSSLSAVERLAKLSTCVVADAMVELRMRCHLVGVEQAQGYDAPLGVSICGPALTVKLVPTTGARLGSNLDDYVSKARAGQVVVINAPDGCTKSVFGGMLATMSKMKGVAGVVTDGRVGDVRELCAMNFPAFSTGTSMFYYPGAVAEVNTPIVLAGRLVRHNDIIHGDMNGVIVIPAERAEEVATRAETLEDQDNQISQALYAGESLQRCLDRLRSPLET
ncbi:unnamed protein product [Phytophthora fragariaefolia]|uniref:Unnamed protein product n=1 Tax=Phytophthora fragariaefolia TaxID=1490495 RepID=A0A9W7CU63_9STRA|nr:unnamed protein product [Phytophthora fragariaefolia]